jgi:hypothetical protein
MSDEEKRLLDERGVGFLVDLFDEDESKGE